MKPKAWTSPRGRANWANENRLSPRDPAHRAFLQQELEKFLFGGGAEKPAGYVPPEG